LICFLLSPAVSQAALKHFTYAAVGIGSWQNQKTISNDSNNNLA
jgi:hypothetical protein